MDRGKIKIIEFGKDDESPRTSGSNAGSARDMKGMKDIERGMKRDMKIVEFDHDPPGGGERASTRPEVGRIRPEVGRIRIVEFDDDRPRTKAERTSPPEWRPSASRARAGAIKIGAIKIKEFDDEGQERPRGGSVTASRIRGGASRIRIVEFD